MAETIQGINLDLFMTDEDLKKVTDKLYNLLKRRLPSWLPTQHLK